MTQRGPYSSRRVHHIPVIMRRVWVFIALSTVAPMAAFALAWALFPRFGIGYQYIGFVAFVLIPAQLLGMLIWVPHQRRLTRLARENGGLVCIHCGYDLAGRMSSQLCPECGRGITDEQARAAWGSLIQSR